MSATSTSRSCSLTATAGVLTLGELEALADATRAAPSTGCVPGPRRRPDDRLLGLTASELTALLVELEHRCGVPLLDDARHCRTPLELVRLVNTQVLSGI